MQNSAISAPIDGTEMLRGYIAATEIIAAETNHMSAYLNRLRSVRRANRRRALLKLRGHAVRNKFRDRR